MVWLNAVVQGVLLGGLYALLAAGLSLMFGVMRLVNLAHGALAVLSAYGAVVLVRDYALNPWATLLVVVPVMAGVGFLLQTAALNRAIAAGPLAPLLVTFGLAIVVESALLEIFSADTQALRIGHLATDSIRITDDLSVGVLPLLTFGAGVVAIGALQTFLFHTGSGRAMRATSEDRWAAQLMGIDDRRVFAAATAIAFGLAAVAGIFLGMRTTFTPTTGGVTLLFAFEAVVIGGLGSLWGTLVGGMILAVAQAVGAQIEPAYGVLAGHLVFLAVLAFRPQGLFPRVVNP